MMLRSEFHKRPTRGLTSITFSIIMLISISCARKGSISGKILRADQYPVADAKVEVGFEPFFDTTDESGKFLITGVPAGKYAIIVCAYGYLNSLIPDAVVNPDDTTEIDITLEPENKPISTTVARKENCRKAPPSFDPGIWLQEARSLDGKGIDQFPAISYYDPPDYPDLPWEAQIEGDVIFRLVIDREGRPRSIQLSRSNVSPVMERSAELALLKMRFYPALRDGDPIESTVFIPISFRIIERNPRKWVKNAKAIDGGRIDVFPKLRYYAEPASPESDNCCITMIVIADVIIGVDGRVKEAKLVKSNMFLRDTSPALRAIKNMIFEPALRDGQPIECKLTVPIEY